MSALQRLKSSEMLGIALSVGLHVVAVTALLFVQFRIQLDDVKVAIESLFAEERTPEEFTRELTENTDVADNLNLVPGGGGMGSIGGGTGGGGGGPAVSQAKIDGSGQFSDPVVSVSVGDMGLPGLGTLGNDLGEGEIQGDPQAASEGYGPALSRISQEMIRMMREDRIVVAWLFDESESMKDDQKEIREQFHKVYEELGIAMERDQQLKGGKDKETLLTSISSFGKDTKSITPKPTSNVAEIRAAIDKIPNDPSGEENIFAAVSKTVDQHKRLVTGGGRKLVIVIVTDESGDDGEGDLLEEAIKRCKAARAPVYILGRESLFGYKYARMRWQDPKYGLDHWLVIHRGPETPYPEALQYDGLHDRWDSHPSGFAPYELARLAKETGGIFFLLPHEEQNLVGQAAIDARKYAFLEMKEYSPDLSARRRYAESRSKSKFRLAIAEAVRLLDPRVDPQLNIQESWYSTDPERFKSAGQESFQRAVRAMGLLNQAIVVLDKVKPLREKEESARWRANFDLAYAQLLAYRVRLFQLLLVLDAHQTTLPKPTVLQNNVWNVGRVQEMQVPTERQIKLTKVDVDELNSQLARAKQQFEFVKKTHPNTPWAARAQYELNQGFGMKFFEGFRDPRYDRAVSDIKFPTL